MRLPTPSNGRHWPAPCSSHADLQASLEKDVLHASVSSSDGRSARPGRARPPSRMKSPVSGLRAGDRPKSPAGFSRRAPKLGRCWTTASAWLFRLAAPALVDHVRTEPHGHAERIVHGQHERASGVAANSAWTMMSPCSASTTSAPAVPGGTRVAGTQSGISLVIAAPAYPP